MRHLALLVAVLPSVALAQRSGPSSKDDTAQEDLPDDDKPKRKIIDPWGRLPRPRDKMRLPDPRTAAEKAADRGTVAPTSPVPAPPPEPPATEQVTAEPAAAPAPAPPVTVPPLPPPRTPFRTTTLTVVPPPPVGPREGLTLEVGTGVGWIVVSDRSNSVASPGGVAGVSIGIGGWLSEDVALTGRIAGSSVPSSKGLVVSAFIGPSLQMWVSKRTWLGAGLGLASFGIDAERPENDRSLGGYGFDLRLGHTFYANRKHTLNASIEVTPSLVGEDRTVTSLGVLFGWQYL